MRQLCNISYVAQAEAKTEPGEFQKWETELLHPPADVIASGKARGLSRIAPELEALMSPGGVA